MGKHKKPRSKHSKGAKQSGTKGSGPSPAATSYTGPISLTASTTELTKLIRLSLVSNVSFGASPGSVSFVNDPSTGSEWSQFANLYSEFRVCAQRVRYVPSNLNYTNGTPTLALYAPWVSLVQRDAGAANPLTNTAAFQSDTAQPRSPQARWCVEARAGTAQEMLFVNTRTPTATWKVTFLADTNTPLFVYGQAYIEILVQFRSRF